MTKLIKLVLVRSAMGTYGERNGIKKVCVQNGRRAWIWLRAGRHGLAL